MTFRQIQEAFDTILLLADRDLVKLVMAVIIGNQLQSRRPIWLMLVAPPSSGKTTVLNTLLNLEVVLKSGEKMKPTYSISDITDSTFASGMMRSDRETSLLFRVPYGGVLMFKDFTSILSKREEEKRAVMAQLREIYDGAYKKEFGTGECVNWTGKLGAIGGVTQAVYQHLESMSVMGDRFMLYQIEQPDRKDALRFKLNQEDSGTTEDVQMPIVTGMVHQYMQQAFDSLSAEKITLDPEQRDEIIDVADFCTMVRSGVITNAFSGEIQFVPDPEMPMRMFEQMLALASTFLLMQKIDDPSCTPKLTASDLRLIYKIAYDSIPVVRRIALKHLAQYSGGVDTAALATKTNYPTPVVAGWLAQLNGLGVVERVKRTGFGNWWRLRPQYAELMHKLYGVKVLDEWMTESSVADPETTWERDKERATFDEENVAEAIKNDEW